MPFDGAPELMPFEEACEQVVTYLKQAMPMASWSVTRMIDGRQTHLSVQDDAYGRVAGDSTDWSGSLCRHMVAGTGPAIAPDAMAVPEYADAATTLAMPIGAYVGVPIRAANGALFGTICGLDPEVGSAEMLARASGLRLLADLLGRVLEASSLRLRAERRAQQVQDAQASLVRSEAMYRLLVGASRDVISRHAMDGELTFVSAAVEQLSGWSPEELVGRQSRAWVHPEDLARLPAAEGDPGGRGGEWTFRVRHRQGHWVWVEATSTVLRDDQGQPSEVLVYSRDITARRAREVAANRRSMERLSAGLAHGINTPIQYVGDNTRFLAEAFEDLIGLVGLYRGTLAEAGGDSEPARLPAVRRAEEEMEIGYLETEVPSAVEQTLAGIDRVAKIVQAMKTLSHPGDDEHVAADLNEALGATVTVLRHQVSQVADLELELGDLPPVCCNVADLNQVFLNLVVNAADAVEETGRRGVIRVATVADGADVVLTVSDTGNGIPEDVREEVFDPFFTTKQVGLGTGQGLSMARSVVHEGHGGSLSLDTEPGRGTTVTVRLPIAGNGPARSLETAAVTR
jgi:PAS domain S-box-containing protein